MQASARLPTRDVADRRHSLGLVEGRLDARTASRDASRKIRLTSPLGDPPGSAGEAVEV